MKATGGVCFVGYIFWVTRLPKSAILVILANVPGYVLGYTPGYVPEYVPWGTYPGYPGMYSVMYPGMYPGMYPSVTNTTRFGTRVPQSMF